MMDGVSSSERNIALNCIVVLGNFLLQLSFYLHPFNDTLCVMVFIDIRYISFIKGKSSKMKQISN